MKIFIALGSLLAFLSVSFGAFGAHVLKPHLGEHYFPIFQTGVQYQMFHSLGLILIGILAASVFRGSAGLLQWAGWLLVLGTVLFSGSLYALSLSRVDAIGIITPFGGVAFLIGWALLFLAAIVG
ncbi:MULTISPECIES: DUF423 domain-containing protein [unclassified Sporolactobacillus]|uniref:DUF423 domain-containing protein n=1 Tax=unclassified Sporolactobacillus TaxID=2628533 RepID=UPI00236810C1|nr:DUF423 domain-containing protein [Sporolactobacillus sp. CQH2019]MDD9148340.1 DUF423 domain-containing protein [Sporolactobacillus sp. CQH2019]